MPASRMVEVLRIIENDDANLLAFHGSVVVYPVGALAPDVLFRLSTFGIGHHATVLFRHAVGQANGEKPFFRIRESDWNFGREGAIDIDRSNVGLGVEGKNAA